MMAPAVIEVDAFLADAVQAVQGKLFALGVGWNLIWTTGFPTRHDRIGLGIVVRVPWTATNQQHKLEIHLESEDGETLPLGDDPQDPGRKLTSLTADFTVGRPPEVQHGDEQIVPFAIQINNLPFEAPGRYVFVFSVDGAEARRLPFRVVQQQPAIQMR